MSIPFQILIFLSANSIVEILASIFYHRAKGTSSLEGLSSTREASSCKGYALHGHDPRQNLLPIVTDLIIIRIATMDQLSTLTFLTFAFAFEEKYVRESGDLLSMNDPKCDIALCSQHFFHATKGSTRCQESMLSLDRLVTIFAADGRRVPAVAISIPVLSCGAPEEPIVRHDQRPLETLSVVGRSYGADYTTEEKYHTLHITALHGMNAASTDNPFVTYSFEDDLRNIAYPVYCACYHKIVKKASTSTSFTVSIILHTSTTTIPATDDPSSLDPGTTTATDCDAHRNSAPRPLYSSLLSPISGTLQILVLAITYECLRTLGGQ